MCRSSLMSLAACILMLSAATDSVAAPPLPSGTIACVVHGDVSQGGGKWRLHFAPMLSSTPSRNRVRVTTNLIGTCDNSGVSGGAAPITNVKAYLSGKLSAGTTCDAVSTAPAFDSLRIKIIWQALDGTGRPHKVAHSVAKLGSMQWDGGLPGPIFTNTPLKGAFEGSSSTLKLSMDYPQHFAPGCGGPIDGVAWGDDGNSSLTIP